MNIFKYNRIIIIGNNGSGKSFLSEKLSEITGLPLVHLDLEFWRPGWEMPLAEEWAKRQEELILKEEWIIEGNHTGTMELRFKAADLVIFLDINRFVCLAGVLKRNGKKRPGWPQYLEERFDSQFFQFCRGLWNFSKTRRNTIMNLHKKYPEKPFFVIKSRRELNKLLSQWRGEKTNYIKSA